MKKQVLILSGSPRAGGNTEALVDAFVEGLREAGHDARIINVREQKINGCVGCYKCFTADGTPCVQKDDMQKIYDAFDSSDMITFASPLYWWGFTGQLKIVLDRIFALVAHYDMKIPQKDCAMLIVAEDARPANFEQIIPFYKTCLTSNLNWTEKGMILAGGVTHIGDIQKTDYLDDARKLGREVYAG